MYLAWSACKNRSKVGQSCFRGKESDTLHWLLLVCAFWCVKPDVAHAESLILCVHQRRIVTAAEFIITTAYSWLCFWKVNKQSNPGLLKGQEKLKCSFSCSASEIKMFSGLTRWNWMAFMWSIGGNLQIKGLFNGVWKFGQQPIWSRIWLVGE